MKVLFLTNIPSPYRADFFNELGKLCDLTVTFEGLQSSERDKNWVGEGACYYKSIFFNGIRTNSDQFLCFKVIKILKQKWDRIIVTNYSSPTSIIAISYMNLHKIPFILQADGGFIPDHENILKHKFKKHLISSAHFWMCSGNATIEYFAYYGAIREKCAIFPFSSLWSEDIKNARELRNSNRVLLKEKLGIKEPKVVLSVGRFSYNSGYGKGFDILMKAAEKLPSNVGVYIVGDEPTYACADIFVLMTRADVWGLVINEAMAFSLPIITTDKCLAGLELVKDNENGFVLPIDNTNELFQKILYIINSKSISSRFGYKSWERIQFYNIENMAKENYRILEDIREL